MEFREVVRRRRMVRRYADRPVDPAVVDRMLEHAAARAQRRLQPGLGVPGAGHPRRRRALLGDDGAPTPTPHNAWLDGMRTAPVVIVPLTSKAAYLDRYAEPDKGWTDRDEARWPVPYWYVDAGMAALLILQTAVDEGLGACFFGIQADAPRRRSGRPSASRRTTRRSARSRSATAQTDTGAPGSPARRERRTNVVHRGRW